MSKKQLVMIEWIIDGFGKSFPNYLMPYPAPVSRVRMSSANTASLMNRRWRWSSPARRFEVFKGTISIAESGIGKNGLF